MIKAFQRQMMASDTTADFNHTRAHALACIPEKYPDIREESLDSGEMILAWQVPYRPLFQRLKRFMGNTGADGYEKRLQLDLLGVHVWQLMDGQASVKAIADMFAREYSLNPREAEVSVTAFIRSLGGKGLVRLRYP